MRACAIIFGVIGALLIPVEVLSAGPPNMPACNQLPGCGAIRNVLAISTIPGFVRFLLRIATGLSVIFVVLAGYLMLFSWGDEGSVTKGRWAVVYALLGLSLAIGSRLIVTAVTNDSLFAVRTVNVITFLQSITNILLTLFNGFFLIVLVFAGMRMVFAHGNEGEIKTARMMVGWSIGGAIIANAANAIVHIITEFFGT
jgi:hypothetical protein